MNIHKTVLVFFLMTIIWSCSESRWKVNTSTVNYQVEILRLDQDLFAYKEGIYPDELLALKQKYGDFIDIYLTQIMQVGPADNRMTAGLISRFLTDKDWQQLQEIIDKAHPDLTKEAKQLENAFKRYAVFFNETKLPQITAYNSGFNVGIYPDSSHLAMGLEWYSGSDLEILDRLPPDLFPLYKRDKMMPEFMVANAMRGWLLVKYQDLQNEEDLLSRMAFSGKMSYITKVLLEEVTDREILNYTPSQLEWCKRQEYEVWKFLMEKELLFSTQRMETDKIINDGPFTPGMPPESPGGVGNFIGFQMVKSYMEKNKEMSLKDLLYLKNDRELLNNYKPGR